MRDKQQVQSYRSKITDKLRRENRIRGQPRQSYVQAQTQSVPGTPSSNPTPAPAATRSRPRPKSYVSAPSLSANTDWSSPEVNSHRHSQAYISSQGLATPISASNSPHITQMPCLSLYPEQTLNPLDLSAHLPYQLLHNRPGSPIISLPTDSLPNIPFGLYPSEYDPLPGPYNSGLQSRALRHTPSPVQLGDFSTVRPIQHRHSDPQPISGQTSELVLYFFEHVNGLLNKFHSSSNDITNILYSIIVQEPRGAVANAICALANLHSSRARQAAGYELPDPNPDHSYTKFLYDQAFFQLINANHLNGAYTETDAIAALHLTSFSLLSDGWTNWVPTLQIAQDWLASTGISTEENPRLFVANLPNGSAYAAKATMWLDIFSSITLMQPPRFMDVYHRMFKHKATFGSLFEPFTGFPDEILYAIAQTSELAHWKSQESLKGTLSTRELIRRGDIIERGIRDTTATNSGLSLDLGFGPELSPLMSGDSNLDSPFLNDDTRRGVRDLFKESALLYLHTTLSDPNPGVHEISTSVANIIQLIQQQPMGEVDQSVVLPIYIAGCMTDNLLQRQYLSGRLRSHNNLGNLLQTRSAMENVWHKRDVLRQTGAPGWETVDWREGLRNGTSSLLLV